MPCRKANLTQVRCAPIRLSTWLSREKSGSRTSRFSAPRRQAFSATRISPFLFSTRLYPEWPFARLQHTSLDITEQVCTALLSIQRDDIAAVTGQYAGWTPSLNYQSVHDCLKELRYGPYKNFGRITFRDVLKKYWPLILFIALLIVLMTFIIYFMVALNWKLQQSQIKLKKEEENLRRSEIKFRSIIEESAEGIMLTDEQGMVIEWNRSLEQISGFKRADVIGRPVWDVQFEMAVDEKKSQPAYEQLKSLLVDLIKTGTYPFLNRPIEREVKRLDGIRCFVQTLISAIQTGRGFMVVGFLLDIAERKQAEEALARLNRQTELILSSAGEGILGLDSEGRHTFINPVAARMLGYEPQELIGIPSHITWHHTKPGGSSYPVEECPIYASYRSGIPHMAENEMFWRKDGTCFPVEYTSTPIGGDGGSITGAVVTFSDITKRKAAQQQLIETKDYLENIINSSWDAIVISDNAGRIIKCNRSFLNLVGYTEDEVVGRYVYDFTPITEGTYESSCEETVTIDEAFLKEAQEAITTMIENGNVANWQTYVISKSQKVIPIEENIVLLFDDAGNRIGAVGTSRDITVRRRTENERERLIVELQKALVQVKTLSGFIPICSSCKKVRNDSGYWEQVEAYISTRSEAEFSHSICPDCAKRLYPEIYAEISKDKK